MNTKADNTNNNSEPLLEPILDPSLEIIDAHIHLWDLTGFDYFAPEYLKDVGSGHRVDASVYIECGMRYAQDAREEFRPVGETRYVIGQIEAAGSTDHRLAAAIMGGTDLTLGARVRPVLEAHIEAGKGRFRGIRARATWDADALAGYGAAGPQEGVLRHPEFIHGARCMEDLDLVLDIWAFHTQLDEIFEFARRCPGLAVAVNHVGGPLGVGRYAGHREEVFKSWSAGIKRLSDLPNVSIKLGGLGISRLGFKFAGGGQASSSDELAAAWEPYIRTCVEAFGPQRSVFGSNFPVDRAVAQYPILLNAFKKMLAGYSDSERKAMFSQNAKKLYRI